VFLVLGVFRRLHGLYLDTLTEAFPRLLLYIHVLARWEYEKGIWRFKPDRKRLSISESRNFFCTHFLLVPTRITSNTATSCTRGQ